MQKTNVYRLISLGLLINIIPLKAKQEGLTILNDTNEEKVVRYRLKSGETVTKRLSPGKQFSFVQGSTTIRHYNHMYTVTIPLSHPVSLPKKLTLKEIMEAAKQQRTIHGGEGKIGNIEVFLQTIGLNNSIKE